MLNIIFYREEKCKINKLATGAYLFIFSFESNIEEGKKRSNIYHRKKRRGNLTEQRRSARRKNKMEKERGEGKE